MSAGMSVVTQDYGMVVVLEKEGSERSRSVRSKTGMIDGAFGVRTDLETAYISFCFGIPGDGIAF